MVTENTTQAQRSFSPASYPTYNHSRGVGGKNYSGTPFNRVLATLNSSTVAASVKATTEDAKPLQSTVEVVEQIPQQFSDAKLSLPLFPKTLDEPTRSMFEDRVRQKKSAHEKCPFVGVNGECCRPDIRCGERAQFSGRESEKQHKMPHRCLYVPYFASDNVIVVEQDPIQREFMLNSFKLFLNYDLEKIAILESAEAATEILTQYKLQNRMIGLVIINCSALGTGVFQFLTELYERNINADIILTSDVAEDEFVKLNKFMNLEVTPGFNFIAKYLQTPIHTEKLVDAISSLHFGRFF